MAIVKERVIVLVVDTLGVAEEQVTEEADWVQLKADLPDLTELFRALEQEFSTESNQVKISEEDAGNINTIGDIIAYLKNHGVKDPEAEEVPTG